MPGGRGPSRDGPVPPGRNGFVSKPSAGVISQQTVFCFEADPAPSAPEICVEGASPGNTTKWLLEKAAAYLAAGAIEVVVIELDGLIRYYDEAGERAGSSFGVELTLPPSEGV